MFREHGEEIAKNAVVGLAGALIGYAVASLISELLNPTYDAVMEAFDFQADPNHETGFRNVIRDEVMAAVAEVASSAVDFGPRARLFSKLGMSDTEGRLRIQSISLSQKWQTTQILEELFRGRPQLTVKILLIHPYSPHVQYRENDIGFRDGTIRQLVEETILPLASLKSNQGIQDRLQVRGYFAIPYYGIISCDSSRCLVTLSREGRGGDQNYGMLIEGSTQSSSAMITDLERGFDDRWSGSFDLLSPLQLTLSVGERTSSGEIVVQVLGETDIDEESIDILVENAELVERASTEANKIQLKLLPEASAGRPVRVQLLRAFSKDHHQWLRTPVEITVGITV
ncbi:hypothetical protein [Streptomyces sp. NBC_00370]|uniref:hypothetical protein n=1 Tax=Streptomyces sp. NBC_00370 TaxID=2975728 RepID=UPI002E257B18